ncbi:MAG: hypothetical protein EXR73_12640 [Myxococcales bacterium]|nr:hypothetical protein [Myxococcales bacterium]
MFGSKRRLAGAIATVAAAAALTVMVSGRGCHGQGSPEGAVRAFLAAARDEDKQAAWELLGPVTRARLEQDAVRANLVTGDARRYGPLDLLEFDLRGSGPKPPAPRVVERGRDAALVEVTRPDGQRDRIATVRVGDGWLLEL